MFFFSFLVALTSLWVGSKSFHVLRNDSYFGLNIQVYDYMLCTRDLVSRSLFRRPMPLIPACAAPLHRRVSMGAWKTALSYLQTFAICLRATEYAW
jgi:hypothetical protein